MIFRLGVSNPYNFFFYVLFFRNSAMTMKMMKQKKRTQMICTNRWLETQTIYLISLVIFVKIPFCISKENCIFVQICYFICIFRPWSFRKSWSMHKMLQKHGKHGAFFVGGGGSRHPREAMCKVSALLYFFPTKNVIHLDYMFNFIQVK